MFDPTAASKPNPLVICTGMMLTGILLVPAICCVVIAARYQDHSKTCALTQDYTIDLPIFLNAVGYGSITYVACLLVIQSVLLCTKGIGNLGKTIKYLARFSIVGCLWAIFLVVWTGVGLSIYVNELSDECQKEEAGVMMLVWAIFMYALFGPMLCLLTCCSYALLTNQ